MATCLPTPCAWPACNTFPITTSSRLAGSIFASSITCFAIAAPRSLDDKGAKLPKKLPIADLFAATMYTLLIKSSYT